MVKVLIADDHEDIVRTLSDIIIQMGFDYEIAAAEPQIQDLGIFLKTMGVNIEGTGTHTILIIPCPIELYYEVNPELFRS